MSVIGIAAAAAIVGVTGLVIGLLLGIAGEKFKVEVNEKEILIRQCLPGVNCGACGYAGCDALAEAIASGIAKTNQCPVAGQDGADAISEIMGVKEEEAERDVAYVKCAGSCEQAGIKYNYFGNADCKMAAGTPGFGNKKCGYGCLGYGNCVKVCPFDAIHIVNGIAEVDKEACRACGKCIAECPKQIIGLIPYDSEYVVACKSMDKGKDVKAACGTGCIGCNLCKKVCEYKAIEVENNLAVIDQFLCTGCGKCAEKCPVKIIKIA